MPENIGASLAIGFLALILALAGIVLPETVPNGNGNGGNAKTVFGHLYFTTMSRYGARYAGFNSYLLRTTESEVACPIGNGTFSELRLYATLNTHDAGGTVWVRVNGANSALYVFVAGGVAGYHNATTDVSVSAGDLVNFKMDFTNASSGTLRLLWSLDFEPV